MELFLKLVFASFASAGAPLQPADIVLQNGSIYTLDSASSTVEALTVNDGIVTFVGSNAQSQTYVGNATRVINLQGHAVIPGLIDSHMHILSGGLFLLKCDLSYQPLGLEEILQHVQGCIDDEVDKPSDAWIEVVNMDYPTLVTRSGAVGKKELDRLNSKRPVLVRSSDYHTVIVNSRALELSNITAATPDPPNGKIERLPTSNEPSGVLQDQAYTLLAGPLPPTHEENVAAGQAALQLLRQAGITTFQEAAASETHYEVFRSIQQAGNLSARAFFDYRVDAPNSTDAIATLVHAVSNNLHVMNDNLTLRTKPSMKWNAIKAFIDGVITYPARTAALVEPYWNPVNGSNNTWVPDPSTTVTPYWNPSVLAQTLEEFFLAGIDAQLHVDGDLAVRVALDAAESFQKKHPKHDFRLGLAHDELSHPDDWARFAKLNVDAIMSFQWAQLSSFYIPSTFASLAEYRHNNLQAYAEIEKAGRPVVYGSDWPIDPLDEFLALKVAVTRSGDPENPNSPASQGPPYDGIFPGKGISREAALRAITINGARFLRADKYIGSLETGKFADLVVLENDYFKVPDTALGRQRVLLTMVGGDIVYVAERSQFENVTANNPNQDMSSLISSRRMLGGLDRRGFSRKEMQAISRLRKRKSCIHDTL